MRKKESLTEFHSLLGVLYLRALAIYYINILARRKLCSVTCFNFFSLAVCVSFFLSLENIWKSHIKRISANEYYSSPRTITLNTGFFVVVFFGYFLGHVAHMHLYPNHANRVKRINLHSNVSGVKFYGEIKKKDNRWMNDSKIDGKFSQHIRWILSRCLHFTTQFVGERSQ